MTSSGTYPWHKSVWDRPDNLKNLPHALMIAGARGLGKRSLATRLAERLLCMAPTATHGCGNCKGCHLFQAGTHPDLLLVEPEESKKEIVIDQIRALAEFMALRPHTAAHKVALIFTADNLNLHAANGLLKMLEEPPAGSYLLLASDQPGRLLPTIRSRCVRLDLVPPPIDQGIAWLRTQTSEPEALLRLSLGAARQAPLGALRLLEQGDGARLATLLVDLEALTTGHTDPATVAAVWKKAGSAFALDWLQGWLADALAARQIAPDPLQASLAHMDPSNLHRFLDAVTETRRLVHEPLDELLLLEDLLIRWLRLRSVRARG